MTSQNKIVLQRDYHCFTKNFV